jgi:thiosulfate/3-mercaptopyruvate sulfurtransferase
MRTIVSTDELARHPEWRVFDCRFDLAKPDFGERHYAAAHIPGALYAHLDRDLSAPKSGTNGRHPLPGRDAFPAWLGRQGVKPADRVVCYDAAGGVIAARLWWLLRWVGHEAVAVLDGGYPKWISEGRPVTRDVPVFENTVYESRPDTKIAVDAAFVENHLQNPGVLLLDARSPVRFRGEKEPIDPAAGRIPGAVNRFCNDNLDAHGLFKSVEALRSEYARILGDRAPQEIVHYCGSGVSACHNALAMEIAGLPGSRLYAGSWSEWIADPRRPQAKGPA